MYTDEHRTKALVVATACGTPQTTVDAKPRWLDDRRRYTVTDVTIDDDGSRSSLLKGTFTGALLKSAGLHIDPGENTSKGKAYWLEGPGYQQ